MEREHNAITGAAPGRPRNRAIRQAILDAAFKLEREKGYLHVSLKEIAELAEVNRQTLYHWWPSKGRLYMELMSELVANTFKDEDLENIELEKYLHLLFRVIREEIGTMALGLFMDGQGDPALLSDLQSYIVGRRYPITATIKRFANKHQKRYMVPLDVVADMLVSPMWYKLISGSGSIDDALAHELVRAAEALLM